jgi:hypothetical protein
LFSSPYLRNAIRLDSYQLLPEYTRDVAHAISRTASREKLKHLSVGGPMFGSDEFLHAICSGDGYPSLTHLALGGIYSFQQQLKGLAHLHAPSLTSLRVFGFLSAEACEHIARLPCSQLRQLWLSCSRVSSDGFRILADAGTFDSLQLFRLRDVVLDPESLVTLFQSGRLGKCTELEITSQELGIGDQLIELLASGSGPALERLVLDGVETTSLARLFTSPVSARIQALSLVDMPIRKKDVAALAHSPLRETLRFLRISTFGKSPFASLTAFRQLVLPNLYCLDLIGDEGDMGFSMNSLTQLLTSGAFPNLRELRLGSGKDLDTSYLLRTMATKSHFPELRQLSFYDERKSGTLDQAMAAILDSERFPKLRLLVKELPGTDTNALRKRFGPRIAFRFPRQVPQTLSRTEY